MIDLSLIFHSIPSLLLGAMTTIQITFAAITIGFFLGTILSIAQAMGGRWVKRIVMAYVSLVRGTPMLVQIFFIFYVLPQFGISIPPFWTASLAIGLNSGAYISQTIRSGISSVPLGQIEAAKTLGLSSFDTMRCVVLPQAIRNVIPSIGNELITLVKDSSLASLIGVVELTKEGSIIRSRTYDAFSVLLAISLLYFLMTTLINYAFNKLYENFWLKQNVKS
jgi:polar amino acid transport system permease protein